MYDLKLNLKENAILCEMKGKFTSSEAEQYVQKFISGIDKLSPNFIVITDISDFIRAEDEVRKILMKGTKYAMERKIGRAFRIVSSKVASKIGNIQFNRTIEELGNTPVEIEEVTSLEEVKRILGWSTD